MTPEQSKRAVIDAWKVFGSRDAQRIAAVFTEDAEWLAPKGNATAVALNFTDHMIGRAVIVKFLAEEFHKLFVGDVSVEFRGIYCDGHTVILEERMQATLANGRRYDNNYCFFFELTDGRISKVREYMDTQKGRECIFG
jgi:uncharacterized protein